MKKMRMTKTVELDHSTKEVRDASNYELIGHFIVVDEVVYLIPLTDERR
jgi:hypothetical protein